MLFVNQILIRIACLCFLFVPQIAFGAWINVTSPAAGANWKTTQTYNIQWNTASTKPTVDIDLYKNGSRKYTIVSGTPNDGQYEWTIPDNTLINKNDEGNIYSISMCADDGCGESAIFSIYFPTPPTPGGFAVSSVTSSSASLSWGTSYGATGYEIYDCDTNSLVGSRYDWFYLGGTVSNLSPETTYLFKMRAVNTSGQSPFTSCINATTNPGPPAKPSPFTATAQSPTSISLSWGAVSSATSYDVQTCTDTPVVTATSQTSYLVTGLAPETTYSYKVQANNAGGSSGFTSCQSATTPSEIPSTYTISGRVIDENSNGLGGVTVNIIGYQDITDANGNYTIIDVPENTSGDLTASKTGCILSTPIPVSNISANLTGKNFTATCSFTISGTTKKADGTAILAAEVTFTGLTSVTSITGGYYSKTVPGGWSGNVCASKTGCNFSCVYVSNITANRPNTDLICTPPNYKVSGYTKRYNGQIISGATVTFSGGLSSVTSGSNGYYEKYVDYGWSGTITASKSGYKFSSENISTVTSPRPGNNIYGDYYPRTGTSASISVRESSWNTRYSEKNNKPCSKYERYCGDPVDTTTGAQILEYTLLSVQGLIPVSFNLAYNSLVVGDEGPAGKGWDFNYGFGAKITDAADTTDSLNIQWSKNRTNRFNHDSGGVYKSSEDACKYDSLVKNADNTFTLTRQDQTVYGFNADRLLSELRDAQNRVLQFAYDTSGRLTRITEAVSGTYLNYAYNAQGLLQTVSDPSNRQISLSYDAERRLKTITDPDNHTITFTYNDNDQILTAVSSEGHQIFANTFDPQGRVVRQDDGLLTNNEITMSYDESQDGKIITTITDRNGASRTFTYDGQYRLLQKTDELGNVSAVYTYDENGNRISAMDGNDHTTHFEYDGSGNMTSVTDAVGNKTRMTYDANNNLTSVTDALGKVTTFEYDAQDRLIRSTDPLNNETVYAYDSHGQLLSVTSPKGHITRYEYQNGLPVKIVYPEGNTQEMGYDASGRVISTTDGSGNTTTISYDPSCPGACRAESVTDPLGHAVSMTYDSRGNLLTLTDANGNVTRYEYNANGNLIRLINALNQITQYEYDGEDRLIRIIDAKGNASTLSYDLKGRNVLITDALGNTRTTDYDKVSNLKIVTDAYGAAVQSLNYDARDNLTQITDALGNSAGFEYDALNRMIRTIDPMSRVTQFTYDALDRLISTTDPAGGTASQTFDKDGNLTGVIDPLGNTTAFAYDGNGRRLSETSAAANTVQYTYNARDLIQSLTNARGQNRQFIYDAAGRLTRMSDPDGAIDYTYDPNGNVLTVKDAAGTITRKYDALNRVTEYTDAKGNVIRYEFDEVGNLTGLIYPDGKKVVYGYDKANRMASVTDWNGRQTGYSYDKESRLIQTTRPNGTVMTRSYNSAGQLVQQKDLKSNGEVIAQYDFTYDAAGNITEEKAAPIPDVVAVTPAVMTYGAANRLSAYNGQSVIHDADGNMIRGPLNGGMADYYFDSRNRLRQVETTVYTHDAENNRIAVSENGVQTKYVINPQAELSQVLVREEHDGTKTYYMYGLGLIGQERSGAYRSFHFDFRGSTVAMTAENGTITHQYVYGAYGKVSVLSEESFNPFRYVGQFGVMFDGNGLYYMRARYYCYEIGRFIDEDLFLDMNQYYYSDDNPIIGIDPEGTFLINLGTGITLGGKAWSHITEGHIGWKSWPNLLTWNKSQFTISKNNVLRKMESTVLTGKRTLQSNGNVRIDKTFSKPIGTSVKNGKLVSERGMRVIYNPNINDVVTSHSYYSGDPGYTGNQGWRRTPTSYTMNYNYNGNYGWSRGRGTSWLSTAKSGLKSGVKTAGRTARRIPVLSSSFFLYDWYTQDLGEAIANLNPFYGGQCY